MKPSMKYIGYQEKTTVFQCARSSVKHHICLYLYNQRIYETFHSCSGCWGSDDSKNEDVMSMADYSIVYWKWNEGNIIIQINWDYIATRLTNLDFLNKPLKYTFKEKNI